MKRVNKLILFMVLLAATLSGCSGKLDPEEYVAWIQDYDNGLHVRKGHGDFVFDVQFTPADMMWLQYQNRDREQLKGVQYYKVTIQPKDPQVSLISIQGTDAASVQLTGYYFSYRFQDAIKLVEGEQQFPCVLYHFEKTMDVKTSRTFIVGFETSDVPAEQSRIVIDSDRFGSLPISIQVSKKNIPSLAI